MGKLKGIFGLCRYSVIVFSVTIIIHLIYAEQMKAATLEATVDKSTDMVLFFWIIIIIGGCIAVTLTYVSWKKYKGEKDKKKRQGKTVD